MHINSLSMHPHWLQPHHLPLTLYLCRRRHHCCRCCCCRPKTFDEKTVALSPQDKQTLEQNMASYTVFPMVCSSPLLQHRQ